MFDQNKYSTSFKLFLIVFALSILISIITYIYTDSYDLFISILIGGIGLSILGLINSLLFVRRAKNRRK